MTINENDDRYREDTDLQDSNTSSDDETPQDPDTGALTPDDPDTPDEGSGGAEAHRNIVSDLASRLMGLFRPGPGHATPAPAAQPGHTGPIPMRRRNRTIEREQEKTMLAKIRAKETMEERLERYRQMVEGFEEDRENFLEKMGRWFFLVLAYVAPVIIALSVGKEIGDAYGGPFDWGNGWSLGMHAGAYFGELALAMMSLASATSLRRMQADRGYMVKLVFSVFFLAVFSLASGLAQWYIATETGHGGNTASLIFRVAMPPAVDIASLLYISVMGFKSLKKHLANMKMMADALRELNDAEIDIRKSQNAAKQQERREDLLMKVESLQADGVIKAVEKSLKDSDDKRGNGWSMRSM